MADADFLKDFPNITPQQIKYDLNKRIVALDLSGLHLYTLPLEIFKLEYLQQLNLVSNGLSNFQKKSNN